MHDRCFDYVDSPSRRHPGVCDGGIGGVHRGSLPEFRGPARAGAHADDRSLLGAKIVLDLPATREWLETHGVTVVGYGCDEMPAFYSRSSGLPVDTRVDTPAEVASWSGRNENSLDLRTPGGDGPFRRRTKLAQILCNKFSTKRSRKLNVQVGGRELTPFLLSRMARQSGGATLQANIALLENNARVAAEIAGTIAQQI